MYPIETPSGRQVSDSYAMSAGALQQTGEIAVPLVMSYYGLFGGGMDNYLGAGLSLLGTGVDLYNSISNRHAQGEANEANIALAREQMAWSEAMWNKQNEYNLPSAQMERFKQAGLNPNLIYGQGNAGNAGAVGSYNRATVQPKRLEFQTLPVLSQYMDLQAKSAQVDNLREQNKLIAAQAYTEAARGREASSSADITARENRFQAAAESSPYFEALSVDARRAVLDAQVHGATSAAQKLFLQGQEYRVGDRTIDLKDIDLSIHRLQRMLLSKQITQAEYDNAIRAIEVGTTGEKYKQSQIDTFIKSYSRQLRELGVNPDTNNIIDAVLRPLGRLLDKWGIKR
jgi:hypothetical protein